MIVSPELINEVDNLIREGGGEAKLPLPIINQYLAIITQILLTSKAEELNITSNTSYNCNYCLTLLQKGAAPLSSRILQEWFDCGLHFHSCKVLIVGSFYSDK